MILTELMPLTILQAEEAAAQSQTVSQEAAKKIDENTTFSLRMVAQVFFSPSDFSSASFTISSKAPPIGYFCWKGFEPLFEFEDVSFVLVVKP